MGYCFNHNWSYRWRKYAWFNQYRHFFQWLVDSLYYCASFISLFNDNDKTGSIVGFLIGIVLLLGCQDIIRFDLIWKLAFPVILVVIGLSLIFKNVIGDKVGNEIKKLNENNKEGKSYCATFGGQNVNFDEEKFTGADVNAIFGGVKLDLKNAIIDQDVVINASASLEE